MDRRSLLQSTGALVVGGLAGSRTGYAALASVAAGHLSHIGVHLYTLRSMLDDDFDGRVDFPAIFTKAEQAGLHYGIVEHDRPGDDPVASIAASYAYLDDIPEYALVQCVSVARTILCATRSLFYRSCFLSPSRPMYNRPIRCASLLLERIPTMPN